VGAERSRGTELLARERDGAPVLAVTRATEFVASSNLKGRSAGANWLFALPELGAEDVLCIGDVSAASLEALAASANVRHVRADLVALPFPDASFDVVFCASGRTADRAAAEAGRVLRSSGVVFVDGRIPRLLPGRRPLPIGGAAFLLAPATGEVKALAPVDDPAAAAFAGARAHVVPRFSRRHARRTLSLRARQAAAAAVWRRVGVLARPDGSEPRPLDYLRRMAAESGLDLAGYRWALAAPGDYASQKVVVFLLDEASRPAYVVKLTRAPEWNGRLDNERWALDLLEAAEVGAPGSRPVVAFQGTAAGLAIVGETAVDGVPFASRTTWAADCPRGLAAVAWLRDLGRATADAQVASSGAVADALDDLASRFCALYASPADEEAFLRSQIDRIRQSAAPFPVVLQHGDPGLWNVLATPDGGVAFLDWEAAEPVGLPLWDLLYFLRSFAVTSSRSTRRQDTTAAFARHYLEPSPLGDLLVETIAAARADLGLDPALVEPLFYTCWMHRALKEATRLRPHRVQTGRFVSLVRLLIQRRDAPALERLFSA
jgi:SAM-dependent methyltransferase